MPGGCSSAPWIYCGCRYPIFFIVLGLYIEICITLASLARPNIPRRAEYVVTGLDELANWARKGSMWPMTFGLA